MTRAQLREDQRERLIDILGADWEREYQPQNIALASIEPQWGQKIRTVDENALRLEFYRCAEDVDQTWFANPERYGRFYYQTEFSAYPMMKTYMAAIRYIGGASHGLIWIQAEPDGGAYDPRVSVKTLEDSLANKLTKFATPETQAHLTRHRLTEHYLLVHGGWNAFKNNTPYHPLTLEQIAQSGAEFYASHPQRGIFDRVWFFDSLDSADDVNVLLGFPPGFGRVRWLAQLWPSLKVY